MLWENTSFERCPDPQTNGDHAICHWNWISWLAIQHNKRNETRLVLPASARRTWLRKLTSQTIPPLAKELQNVITAHAFLCLDKLGALYLVSEAANVWNILWEICLSHSTNFCTFLPRWLTKPQITKKCFGHMTQKVIFFSKLASCSIIAVVLSI